MEYEIITKKVKDIIEEVSGEQPTLEQNFRIDLKLDSLDKVEMIMNIEKEFNFLVEDSKLDGLQTVQQLIDLVNEKVNAGVN